LPKRLSLFLQSKLGHYRTPLPQGPQVLTSLKQGVDGLEAAKNNLGSRLQNNLEIALATDGGLEEFNQV
jgi:hypothetical protein